MKQSPISGTTRTENAPPVVTAVPYNKSQQPGNRAISPMVANTGVSTMPATSGGTYASANRCAGAADDNGVPCRRALMVIVTSAIAPATAASASQIIIHRNDSSGGPDSAAAPNTVAPIMTPSHPATAENSVGSHMTSRM